MKKQYIFAFEDGGWNQVWAESVEEARELVWREFKSDESTPILSTVGIADEEALEICMSTFH